MKKLIVVGALFFALGCFSHKVVQPVIVKAQTTPVMTTDLTCLKSGVSVACTQWVVQLTNARGLGPKFNVYPVTSVIDESNVAYVATGDSVSLNAYQSGAATKTFTMSLTQP